MEAEECKKNKTKKKNKESLGTPITWMTSDGREVDVGGGQCPTANLCAIKHRVSFLLVKYCTVDLVNLWSPGYHWSMQWWSLVCLALLPFCLSVSFEEMTLPHLKSSILVVFYKSNCLWSLFLRQLCILGQYNLLHMDKISAQSFFYNEYITHVQIVCTRPLLGGGGRGWGRN